MQLALAAAGVFRAHAGAEAAREQSVFDPHRANGYVVMLLALLLLAAAIKTGLGRWRFALVLFVLTIVQSPLAHAGTVGGVLHGLNAFLIAGSAAIVAHRAWSVGAQPAEV